MDSSCCDFKENYLGKTSPVQSQVTSRVISDWVGVEATGTEGDRAMSSMVHLKIFSYFIPVRTRINKTTELKEIMFT